MPASPPAAPTQNARPAAAPRFVSGSLLRHVAVMSGTGAIGLIAIFLVDLINLFYISLLGQQAVAAAVGFAGVVGFFQLSFCIGLMIAVAAVVAPAIGAGRHAEAQRLGTVSLLLMGLTCALLAALSYATLDPLLSLLGASGETKTQAHNYLQISLASTPLLGVSMACSALLRAAGDARRAMNVTLIGAVITAVLDPILIFALHLDLQGAAIAAVLARLCMLLIGLHGVTRAHHKKVKVISHQAEG